jgi:hypothetical protein
MAASTHSRKPEKAAKPGSPRSQGESATTASTVFSEALLSLRLWNGGSNAGQPAASPWESDAPAVCLALDLISASEGLPVARDGEVLVASFPTFQAAILAARRLQWAAQGFAEGGEPHQGPLAALIHAPKDDPSQSVGEAVHLLQQAAPEQILLSKDACRLFDNLPGFPLQPASGDGLRELLWRAPQNQSTRAHDEEILARLVEEQGPQVEPDPAPVQAAVVEEDFSAAAATRNTGRFRAEEPLDGSQSSRKVIVGLAAAAVVVAAAGIFYFAHGKSTAAPDQNQTQSAPAAAGSTPAAPESQPDSTVPAHPAAVKPAEAEPASKTSKNGQKGANKPAQQTASDTPREEKVAPPAKSQSDTPRGRCDLDPSQFGGQIDQAWKKLGRGKYADAQREFGAVLACDPGNGRAKEGLERARMAAREADGSPEN